MSMSRRHAVRHHGSPEATPLVLVHGFGCDQTMWHHVVPALARDFHFVTFDLAGAGAADPAAWDAQRYSRLEGYAEDLVALLRELGLRDPVLVGHSVSAMIVAHVQVMAPELVGSLVMVGPSPRYVDDGEYVGGFSAEQIEELLASLSANYVAWSHAMAPVIAGNPGRPEVHGELAEAFCRMDPGVAEVFARTTFLSDARDVLPRVTAPTLVLQCSEDVIAPQVVGEYVARQVPDAELVLLRAAGHCPQLSDPEEIVSVLRERLLPGDPR
jgi:sigma-B regulation protein RsbQ